MSKMWLISKREYLTRVRNKTFLLSTFLLPLVFILFMVGSVVLGVKGKTRHRIAVIDANNYLKDYLRSDSFMVFDFSTGLDTVNYEQKGCSAVLIVPVLREGRVTECRLKYKKQLGLQGIGDLEYRVGNAITDHMIFEKTNTSRARLDSIRASSHVANIVSYEDRGKEARASSSGLSYGIGYASGLLIYILTFIYGAAVMRGVMEEKTNRIAEVIVSSVRPFELMMGKITGIGAVGVTQLLLWVLLIGGLVTAAQDLIPQDTRQALQSLFAVINLLHTANWGLILFCFLFYFLGGYLFYSSLFAAIGSAVNEDPQDAQALMMPVTMPIIFSFFVMSVAIQEPGGPLAVWGSIIPFSAPIVMMARIPFGVPGTVPWWQLGLSMSLLVAGFVCTVWIAGKIYRTGILMYGKKATWKTMWKWAFKRA